MVVLVEKESPFFDRDTAEKYFVINKENLDDEDGFEALLNAGLFYNLYNKGYVGSIFAYRREDGNYYLGGYAKRKRHKECIEAVKKVSAKFYEIYAETRHKTAVICLLRAGFKWFNKEKGILRRVNK